MNECRVFVMYELEPPPFTLLSPSVGPAATITAVFVVFWRWMGGRGRGGGVVRGTRKPDMCSGGGGGAESESQGRPGEREGRGGLNYEIF